MTSVRINRAFLDARVNWVESLTKLSLALDKNAAGWTLYLADPSSKGKLIKPLAFHESPSDMFQTLKALYELCATLKSEEKLRVYD